MEQWVQVVIIGLAVLIGFIFFKIGYKRGLIDSICSLLSVIVGLLSLSFLVMLYGAFQSKSIGAGILFLALLLVLGISYKVAKLILAPLKGLKNLFLLKQLDSILGGLVGVVIVFGILLGINYLLGELGYGRFF